MNRITINKATIDNGKIKLKTINKLTCECWSIQMWGLDACKRCEFRDTDECGGQKILKRLNKDALMESNEASK